LRTILAAAVVAAAPLSHALADTGIVAVYEAAADEIWALVDFHEPSEAIMPPIASSTLSGEGLGATKTNVLAGDGGEINLLLVYHEPSERAFNYTITEGPLPVENYVGVVRVSEAGDGRAELSWRGVYDPAGVSEEEADAILGGFYASIADRIGETFERVE
jgi:hypothetical protein